MGTPSVASASPLVAKLAKPSAAYQRRAWLAMAGLAGFVLLYFALAGWFALTAHRLTFGADAGAKDAVWGWLVGGCAAFLSAFMWKAVFFKTHGGADHSLEITAAEQPELFRFLHRLADKAGAPRPHKVFVSPRVNAGVFYDLSLMNLFFPSKKNLEIGLGLVNSLTLGELRAVLAHEFGHFAQRAMAVGRWVYVGQQIAVQLVAGRDKLDDFMRGLSRLDPRIAWLGWLLRLIVWSIRSLVESAFQLVVLMQRALSREMEMNADLVAVSLTGSDALIHALHRLQAADDAWDRAAAFAFGEQAKGQTVRDVFAVQTRVVEHMARLLNDADHGRVPAAGTGDPATHRVFSADLAQPPQMWLTHPLNHEREANAKRRYVSAPIDSRSAWALFAEPQALRERVTRRLLDAASPAAEAAPAAATGAALSGAAGASPADANACTDPAEPVPDDALAALDQQFARACFDTRYRGVYFGRSIVRGEADARALVEPMPAPDAAAFDTLYPESLVAEMAGLRRLVKEVSALRALQFGVARPPNGVILHRGRPIARKRLPQALQAVEAELAAQHARLQAHDRRCRGTHRAAASAFGAGWAEHLDGLLAALHYAEHTEDNLRDLHGLLGNTVGVVTATTRVGKAGIARVVVAGNALRDAMDRAFTQAPHLRLDPTLLERLAVADWASGIGELKLPGVTPQNIGDWMKAVDSWAQHTAGTFGTLRVHALEQLLLTEARLAQHVREGTQPDAAPAATQVPAGFETLLRDAERQRQTRLGLWARFQRADGLAPAGARLLVAGAVVGSVLGLGGAVGSAQVTVYNGLARPVLVSVGGAPAHMVGALGTRQLEVDAGRSLAIETRTLEGRLIERFDAEIEGSFGQRIYNVAGAAPLVEWTASYGQATAREDRLLGTPRWTSTAASVVLVDAPTSISSKSGGGTREVLSALGHESPARQLGNLATDAERARLALVHARFDPVDSTHLAQWLWAARPTPEGAPLLAARLAEAPDNLMLLRMEQDAASDAERPAVCERHRARAAAAPLDANRQYLQIRCLPEGAAKNAAFAEGRTRFPKHGWFAYATAYADAENLRWNEALAGFEFARNSVPALAEPLALEIARLHRLLLQDRKATLAQSLKDSAQLQQLLALESGEGVAAPALKAYAQLARGQLPQAVQMAHAAPATEARVLRLAAASDGADAGLVARALALPLGQGIDDASVWAAVGLAARAGRDLAPFRAHNAFMASAPAESLLRFADALKGGAAPEAAERLLAGLPTELRGHGYSLGTVVLGERSPKAWRDGAKRLLFAPERPFFN